MVQQWADSPIQEKKSNCTEMSYKINPDDELGYPNNNNFTISSNMQRWFKESSIWTQGQTNCPIREIQRSKAIVSPIQNREVEG
jgi:hypothetical protein